MALADSALALAEACGFKPAFQSNPAMDYSQAGGEIPGALAFTRQLVQVMSDIASEFGEQPEQCAAIILFAVAGMVSDMYAIAADAGLCAVEDVPPHPMRAVPQMIDTPLNRAQRRQMGRDLQHRTPLIVPPGFKARGAT